MSYIFASLMHPCIAIRVQQRVTNVYGRCIFWNMAISDTQRFCLLPLILILGNILIILRAGFHVTSSALNQAHQCLCSLTNAQKVQIVKGQKS